MDGFDSENFYIAFNRTSMESKRGTRCVMKALRPSFNRTSMESKPKHTDVAIRHIATFNRTSMESKRVLKCAP